MSSPVVTVVAPVNIAVIKYWGKRHEDLILPLNDSVSATLDTGVMCAKTSVFASSALTSNEIWLNGKKESFTNKRLLNCLEAIKAIASRETSVDQTFLSWNVHVCSVNNFPTAAGLASSAAGYACLVTALAKLYKVKSDVSCVARLGSGSACRSIYGGFVQWHAGTDPAGIDSIATQIAEASHWPEMRALILVAGDSTKKTSSTEGMRRTVETSELLAHRISHCVPQRTRDIILAIKERNFPKFAEITMKDSNQFHAVCLDSYPPIVYLTEVSHKIIEIIHRYNELSGDVKVAYTFDAGPNACLYLLDKEIPKVISIIKHVFPSSNKNFITGLDTDQETLSEDFIQKLKLVPDSVDLLKYVIHTKVGSGPTEVNNGCHLLDEHGIPFTIIE